jgi:dTDP-3-amino-3,4,6-trideoxy-alpha-D-glucose transaminase
MIPQAAPSLRIARFRPEIDAAISRVLRGNVYILGPNVEAFEAEFAAFCGVAHCVGVGSGTDALALALQAVGVARGDEVITTALTAPATAQAILQTGAVPRFVDVDPATRCIDPAAVAAAITPRTTAIAPVHIFGYPSNITTLMEVAERYGLSVVEDCAQSVGASYDGRKLGSFGHAAAYSFYPTKNLGCVGDGGAVVTADANVAAKVRSLRNYGYGAADRVSRHIGFNSRLDEVQAAILRVLLPHVEASNHERQEIANEYRARLPNGPVRLPPADSGCVYHQFAVTCDDRDALMGHLTRNNIATAVHYTPALHHHPAFARSDQLSLPQTERLAATLLSLPIQPEVVTGFVERICESVARFETACAA